MNESNEKNPWREKRRVRGGRDIALLREGPGVADHGGWKCRNRSPGNTQPCAILQGLKCSLNAIFFILGAIKM